MAELKTKKNDGDVAAFVQAIPDEQRRSDCVALLALMTEVSGEKPSMWGDSIVGFGHYEYRYASGRTGAWFRIGFAPRAKSLSLYLMTLAYDAGKPASILARLGRHDRGKGCLYLRRLADADPGALRELLELAWRAPGMGEVGV